MCRSRGVEARGIEWESAEGRKVGLGIVKGEQRRIGLYGSGGRGRHLKEEEQYVWGANEGGQRIGLWREGKWLDSGDSRVCRGIVKGGSSGSA